MASHDLSCAAPQHHHHHHGRRTVQGTAVGVLGVRSQSVICLVQDLRPCLVSVEEKLAWHVVVRWFFACQEAMAHAGGACLPRALSSGKG